MRKIVLFVLLCLVVAMPAFAGASESTKTTPHQINGVLDGMATFVLLPTIPGPKGEAVDTLAEVSGIVQGLGRTTLFSFHRPYGPNLEFIEDGLVRIVAADGDVIRGHYVGNTAPGAEPNQQISTVDYVITGGTGRFANASGTIRATVYITVLGLDVFEWPVTFVLEGAVSY